VVPAIVGCALLSAPAAFPKSPPARVTDVKVLVEGGTVHVDGLAVVPR
jgi:hypothetical protein